MPRANISGALTAAAEIQRFCVGRDWRFCFIGGIAVQRWGEPRFTHDADLTVLTGIGREKAFVSAFLHQFKARFANENESALRRRVVFIYSSTGVPIDVALGALPFEERCIARATPWSTRRALVPLTTCSAEDLIVHKSFADRDVDWLDVGKIVMRQGRKLNTRQIWYELRPLVELKEEPDILAKLQRIFEQHLD